MDTEQVLLRELVSIEWRPGQIEAASAHLVKVAGWGVRLYRRLGRMLLRTPAYIAPSEFEGFGMPVTEALAAGLPTACSSILPFLEMAGDAAILFSSNSTAQMAGAMKRITSDTAFVAQSKVEGPARARLVDWRSTARLTLEAVEGVARAVR